MYMIDIFRWVLYVPTSFAHLWSLWGTWTVSSILMPANSSESFEMMRPRALKSLKWLKNSCILPHSILIKTLRFFWNEILTNWKTSRMSCLKYRIKHMWHDFLKLIDIEAEKPTYKSSPRYVAAALATQGDLFSWCDRVPRNVSERGSRGSLFECSWVASSALLAMGWLLFLSRFCPVMSEKWAISHSFSLCFCRSILLKNMLSETCKENKYGTRVEPPKNMFFLRVPSPRIQGSQTWPRTRGRKTESCRQGNAKTKKHQKIYIKNYQDISKNIKVHQTCLKELLDSLKIMKKLKRGHRLGIDI